MHDPVFVNRLGQMIQAERLAQAEQARRQQRPHHQPRGRARFRQRVGIGAGALLIAAGRRLQARVARSLA